MLVGLKVSQVHISRKYPIQSKDRYWGYILRKVLLESRSRGTLPSNSSQPIRPEPRHETPVLWRSIFCNSAILLICQSCVLSFRVYVVHRWVMAFSKFSGIGLSTPDSHRLSLPSDTNRPNSNSSKRFICQILSPISFRRGFSACSVTSIYTIRLCSFRFIGLIFSIFNVSDILIIQKIHFYGLNRRK